jgi:predicted ATPase
MIAQVVLRNFKRFASEKFSFSNLTIFSGANAQGKSSVLQSLIVLRQSSELLAGPDRGLLLNGDWVRLGTFEDVAREGREQDDDVAITVTYSDDTQLAWKASAPEQPQWAKWTNQAPVSKRTHYLSADRLGLGSAFSTSEIWVHLRRSVGTRGEYCAHYLDQFGGDDVCIESLRHPAAPSIELSHQLDAWLGLLHSDIQVDAETDESRGVASLMYTFAGEFGRTTPRNPTHVGYGITCALPIFALLLNAMPGDFYMIESPEAHLHPRAQRELAGFLCTAAAAGVQIAIETHSDHILNGIRVSVAKGLIDPRKIRFHHFASSSIGNALEHFTPTLTSSGQFDTWPDGFFDEWDRALALLLTGRGK